MTDGQKGTKLTLTFRDDVSKEKFVEVRACSCSSSEAALAMDNGQSSQIEKERETDRERGRDVCAYIYMRACIHTTERCLVYFFFLVCGCEQGVVACGGSVAEDQSDLIKNATSLFEFGTSLTLLRSPLTPITPITPITPLAPSHAPLPCALFAARTEATNLDGEKVSFETFRPKVCVVVNTASG